MKPVLGIRNRIRIHIIPDPEPLVRGKDPAPAPNPSFSPKCVKRTERMLAKLDFNTKLLAKKSIIKTEDDVPMGKLKEKLNNNIFCILKVTEVRSQIRIH